MYNAMLDKLPEDYNGWLIRTDYRIGVQIQLCISDPELSDSEKTITALHLLYGNGIPDFKTAISGLGWFMSCGEEPVVDSDSGKREQAAPEIYSFEYDAGRIVSAFRKVFGMDISRERLHWFSFVAMFGDLDGTAFTSVMDIRRTQPSDIDKRKRSEFIRMKKRFALPNQYTVEEEATISSVLERARAVPKTGQEVM